MNKDEPKTGLAALNEEMADQRRLFLNAQASPLLEGIKQNEELAKKLIETKALIESSALEVIDCMATAHDAKKEHLTSLRDTRMTVAREVSEIVQTVSRLKEVATDQRMTDAIRNIGEFIELCSRLNALEMNGFFERYQFARPIVDGVDTQPGKKRDGGKA